MAKRRKTIGCFGVIGVIAAIIWVGSATGFMLTSLDPFCGTHARYETNAVIEFEGERYTSTVTTENRRSRGWIAGLNSAGCKEEYGTAHIFRTRENRAVQIYARICHRAEDELSWRHPVDVRKLCPERENPWFHSGIIINDADRPSKWQSFWFTHREKVPPGGYDDVELVSFTAQRTRSGPSDDYDRSFPGLINTTYRYDPERKGYLPQYINYFRGKTGKDANRTEIVYGEFLR